MFNEKGKKFIMQNIKKINKLGILFGIILLLLITLTGCSFEEEEGLRTTINKRQLQGYTEYLDESGIKFSYPSEWESLGESSSQPIFVDTLTGSSVNYLSESVPKSIKIDKYMSSAISNVKEQMDINGDVEETRVLLNGKKATIIEYSINQSGTTAIIKQAVFIEDEKAHILTVVVQEYEDLDQTEIMDNIIYSFTK